MQNVADIFDAWPSVAEFGRDLGLPYQTVSAWKTRGSIPADYWLAVTRAARKRGHPEINADLLTLLHAREAPGLSAGFSEEERPLKPNLDTLKEKSADNATERGHFSRWKHARRAHFASREEVAAHIGAIREEWGRR